MNGALQYIVGCIVLYAVLFIGGVFWVLKKKRSGRVPFAYDTKLLRRPGQHLEECLETLDEKLLDKLIVGFAGPPLICLLLSLGLPFVGREWVLPVLALILLAGGISFVVRLRELKGVLDDRRNYLLGLHGERYVADILRPLASEGYSLFHDIPAEGHSGPFNLDHVVVGPSGVFVIETKARRKEHRNEKGADHELNFDGTSIHWPNGTWDREDLAQVEGGAEWLRKQLGERLVIASVPVKAFLTFPGWMVTRKGRGLVGVCNPKELLGAVRGKTILDAHSVAQIAAQLDVLCRTDSVGRAQLPSK